jgi:hypothetical protein
MLAEPPQQELGTTCVKNPPQHAQRNEKKKRGISASKQKAEQHKNKKETVTLSSLTLPLYA